MGIKIKTHLQKKKEVEKFFADAFCIDGEAIMVDPDSFEVASVIQLTDSKRGTFYIAHVTPIKK